MIIAVDFDGTLSMGPYPEIGNPKPYAVEEILPRLALIEDDEQIEGRWSLHYIMDLSSG